MRGVIFDNDGVVVDSEIIANQVCAATLSNLGFPCTLGYSFENFLGTSLASVRSHVESLTGVPLAASFEDTYHGALFSEMERSLHEVPGIRSVVDELVRRGIPMCIASSGDRERIDTLLRHCDLFEYFEGHIYSAQDVARGKPAPNLFLHAARCEGWDPTSCVVVEDSPYGVQAALSAAMTVVGFARTTPARRLQQAHVVVTDMGSVSEALAQLIA